MILWVKNFLAYNVPGFFFKNCAKSQGVGGGEWGGGLKQHRTMK